MRRQQIILPIVGILLIIFLYRLPRVVVENDQLQAVAAPEAHSLVIPDLIRSEIASLRSSFKSAVDNDKKLNFALSLANRYLEYGILDSASFYGSIIESLDVEPSYAAGRIYFAAYERSLNPEEAKQYAVQARALLEKMLEKDPTNLELKNMWAMTLVPSENPMAGIMALREILTVDENNRSALLNLGLLSIKSNQFDRARLRFEKLVELNQSDHESKLYLAVSLIELNEKEEASRFLNEILASSDSIPAVKMLAQDYLSEL